jgi:hypothetical protein
MNASEIMLLWPKLHTVLPKKYKQANYKKPNEHVDTIKNTLNFIQFQYQIVGKIYTNLYCKEDIDW